MNGLKAVMKALSGALTAFLAALITASADGHITLVEWLISTNAALTAFTAVYWTPWIPNKTTTPNGGNNATGIPGGGG